MRMLQLDLRLAKPMRTLLALVLTAMLLAPSAALAESESVWSVARNQESAGTFGGLTLHLDDNDSTLSMEYENLPKIIETYTATWCTNCVASEGAMSEAVEDFDVVQILYHRHWYEIEDPFGSNSTEERWVSLYGKSSENEVGLERAAPTSVIDGARMHIGSTPTGESLISDYDLSLSVGNLAWFMSGEIQFSVNVIADVSTFSWSFDNLAFACADECPTQKTTAWLMFVEDSANFEDGSNGLDDYRHVLHESIMLEGSNSSLTTDVPVAWDGDDMTAILLIDWEIESSESGFELPGVGIATFLSLLVAVPLARAIRED